MDKAKATYDKAIALAFKALRMNPRSATTMGSLALYFAKRGDVAPATEFVRRARGSEPSSEVSVPPERLLRPPIRPSSDALFGLA